MNQGDFGDCDKCYFKIVGVSRAGQILKYMISNSGIHSVAELLYFEDYIQIPGGTKIFLPSG